MSPKNYPHGRGNYAFSGHGIRLQYGTKKGTIVFAPYKSAYIGLFNPVTNTYSNGAACTGCRNGVELPDGRVMFAPSDRKTVAVYNPETNTVQDSNAHGQGDDAFAGAILLPDVGKVILLPLQCNRMGIYDIATNTYSNGPYHLNSNGQTVTNGSHYYFQEGVYLPDKKTIVLVPRYVNYVGLVKVRY
jgi:hypothetical protein